VSTSAQPEGPPSPGTGHGPSPAPRRSLPGRPAPPRDVRWAFWLGVAAIVVGLVGSVATSMSNPVDTLQQTLQRNSGTRRGVDPFASPTVVTVFYVGGVVFAVVFLVVRVFVLTRMRGGANWARVVLSVLFGMGVVGVGLTAVIPGTSVSLLGIVRISGVVEVVLEAGMVVLMFRSAARSYFTAPQPAGVGGPPLTPGSPALPPRVWAPPVTAQPVLLARERYVSWPHRMAAGLIDYGVPIVVFLVVYVPFTQGSPRVLRGGSGALIMLSVIAVCVGYQVWNSAIRQGRTGQSLGKSLAGTKLVDEHSGRPLGAGRAFGRLLAHFLDSLLGYLGWLLPLVDRRRQPIADKLADSIVLAHDDEPDGWSSGRGREKRRTQQ